LGTIADGRLLARTWGAFAADGIRYRLGVARVVRVELSRWRQSASEIPDATLRSLALAKLAEEGFHAEAGAMLATLAPSAQRAAAVRAIVALEVLYDYLDGRSESPDLQRGRRLFAALTAAVGGAEDGWSEFGAEERESEHGEELSASIRREKDWKYLATLAGAVRESLANLPGADAVRGALQESAARGAEAQVRVHAASGVEPWARSEAQGSGLGWREFLAGAAASVIGCHALIAAAAREGTTPDQARTIAEAYLPVCALTTLLDGIVDHHGDPDDATTGGREGEDGYIGFYADREELAGALAALADGALVAARRHRDTGHHVAMLAGIVAYYATAPGARSGFARGAIDQLRGRFGLLILPMLALMRAWRAARHAREG
jgi:tetraprenyl-beta-curcumene synthase